MEEEAQRRKEKTSGKTSGKKKPEETPAVDFSLAKGQKKTRKSAKNPKKSKTARVFFGFKPPQKTQGFKPPQKTLPALGEGWPKVVFG